MSDQSHSDSAAEFIRVRGARVHNLKNVDLDIPRNRLVVITGPSGSGKSSLAFDTLYAEGQRQFVESLSTYARQFLNQLERPDVDLIDGLQPTVCIDQNPGNQSPRSTVATITEIYDYLRLLLARLGQPTCFRCGAAIRQQSAEQIVDSLLARPEGTKLMLLAPLVRGRKGEHKEVYAAIRKAGFVRARVDGQFCELEHLPHLDPKKTHSIEAVVDRIVVRPTVRSRLAESVQSALRHGEGLLTTYFLDPGGSETDWRNELFNTLYACPECGTSYEELEPRTFSFNSPYGACPQCEGLGTRVEFDPESVLPNLALSLAGGAVVPWKGVSAAMRRELQASLKPFFEAYQCDWETPLAEFTEAAREKLLRGDEPRKFPGVLTMLEKEFATTLDSDRQEELARFRDRVTCPSCRGSRLRPEANSVRFAGRSMGEIVGLSVSQAREFFRDVARTSLSVADLPIADPLLTEINKRLDFLAHVGVDYLTLDRSADTLSGGEMQRVRLATGIGSGLVGVCYILDEPSIGLHPRDNQRLIDALRDLQRQGNTVLVVEHDEAMMRQADELIDVGPGAGQFGGRIEAHGPPGELIRTSPSLTCRYLRGEMSIPIPAVRRPLSKSKAIVIEGVTTNNLKDVTARIPLNGLIGITGVSGSGKSSLINETLVPAVARRLGGTAAKPGPHTSLRGVNQIDKLIPIDQSPIGRSPRSNAATYTGAFDEIRKVFASTREAKQHGFKHNRFSFNAKGGRCEECQGQGVKRIEMNFLPDLYMPCEACGGRRFNRQTLQIRYRGKSIADVLDLSIADAATFFENFSAIQRTLLSLCDVGLGYLSLGQPATTLSGGEAQRIKLATELARVETGNTLYVLDEPTTGLHFDDVRRLLDVLHRLVDRGNTVVVIEHHLDVIKSADWLIDLGPEGGAAGGRILASGTPEEIAAIPDNVTGECLRPWLPR